MRKRWVKRILAMAVTAAMVLSPCVTGMGIVKAEEEITGEEVTASEATQISEEDTTAPYITGVRMVNREVSDLEHAQVIVDFLEDDQGDNPGVTYVSAVFENENGQQDYFWWRAEVEGLSPIVGSASVTLQSYMERDLGTEYQLIQLYIEDVSGNARPYISYNGNMVEEGSFEPVFPQISYAVTTETTSSCLKVTGFHPAGDQDWTNVAVEDRLTFILDFYNESDKAVTIYSGDTRWENKETSYAFSLLMDFKRTTFQPKQSGQLEVTVPVSKYIEAGEVGLFSMVLWGEGGDNLQYTINENAAGEKLFEGQYWSGEDQISYPIRGIPYSGELDFTVTTGGQLDDKPVRINRVTVEPAEVGTMDKVTVKVDYTEEVSGIKYMSMQFVSDTGDSEWFTLYENYTTPEEYIGEAVLELTNRQKRALDSTYHLSEVSIEDYAGNGSAYRRNGEGELVGEYMWDETVYSFPEVSYKVTHETELACVEIVDARIEGIDSANVAAGDTFDAFLTVKNGLDRDVEVDGYVNWHDPNEKIYTYAAADGKIVIPAKSTADIHITAKVSEFAEMQEWMSGALVVNIYEDGKNKADCWYNCFYSRVYDGTEAIELPPSEELLEKLNYTITQSDTPDSDPVWIKEVRVATDAIKTPGTALMELDVDEGNAKLTYVYVVLGRTGVEETGDKYYGCSIENRNLFYSQERQCYVLKLDLTKDMVEGSYYIRTIGVDDMAGRNRYYGFKEPGILGNDQGDILTVPEIVIAESEETDADFDWPVISEMKVNNPEVTAPGTVQYTVKATDESGIGEAGFTYKGEHGQRIFVKAQVEKTGEDTYICTGKIDDYAVTDNYRLTEAYFKDASIRGNAIYYGVTSDGELMFDYHTYTTVPYNGEMDLQVTRTDTSTYCLALPLMEFGEVAPENVAYIEESLEKIPAGSTVILSGNLCSPVSGGTTTISKTALRTIKDSKLQIIMTMENNGAQILIDGSKLTDKMIEALDEEFGLCLAVNLAERLEDKLDFGNAYDQEGYEIDLQTYGTMIPFKVRIPVEDDFYNQNKDKNIHLSMDTMEEELHIIQENLTITDDKYVEFDFENGLDIEEYRRYYISAGTTKLFDHPLDVTATLTSSDNGVQKGSTFDVNLTVTNPNEEPMKDVMVYPVMWDAMDENGKLLDMAGQYQITGDDTVAARAVKRESPKVETDEEGNAIIRELAPGETVRLKASITVPNNTTFEFAQYAFVAASAYSETEVESYGEADTVLSLVGENTVLKGDVNGDGIVDMEDLMEELRIVSGRTSISELSADQIWAADVEGNDNVVSMEDLMKMLRFVSGRITSL